MRNLLALGQFENGNGMIQEEAHWSFSVWVLLYPPLLILAYDAWKRISLRKRAAKSIQRVISDYENRRKDLQISLAILRDKTITPKHPPFQE